MQADYKPEQYNFLVFLKVVSFFVSSALCDIKSYLFFDFNMNFLSVYFNSILIKYFWNKK